MMDVRETPLNSEAEAIRSRLLEKSEPEAISLLRWQVAEARSDPKVAENLYAALRSLENAPDTSKGLRKAARKARYLLEQASVVSKTESPTIEAELAETEVIWRAWMTTTDGAGCAAFVLAKSERPGVFRTLNCYTSEGSGLILAQEETFSTHDLEGSVESFTRKLGSALMAEVDPVFVRYRLREGIRETRSASYRVPPVMAYWASAFEDLDEQMEHPASALVEPALEADMAKLLGLPPASGWIYDLPRLDPVFEMLSEVASSKLAMDEHVKEQRWREAEKKGAAMLFDDRTAARFRTRLLDMTYLYAVLGDREKAAWSMAAVKQIEEHGGESQFALFLLMKSLAVCLAAERERRQRRSR